MNILRVSYMFHNKFPQYPVGLLFLRSEGDQELLVKARIAVFRPVLFTLGLGKGNKEKNIDR